MSPDYVWYTKPGWWVFLVIVLGFMLMVATTPGRGTNQDYSTKQAIYQNVRCYVSPDTESQMICDNPTYYNKPTPRSPK